MEYNDEYDPSYGEELFERLFKDKNSLHGNDYERWDMRKPSVNMRLWTLRNIFKKGHYAY